VGGGYNINAQKTTDSLLSSAGNMIKKAFDTNLKKPKVNMNKTIQYAVDDGALDDDEGDGH
jgi:hypothetical protein